MHLLPTRPAVVTGIRLIRTASAPINAGRLEVQVGGVWGTLCAENFGEREAAVACRQLGKKGGIPHGRSRYGAAPVGTPPLINFGYMGYDSHCIGDEASLTQCSWQFSTGACNEGEVGVQCSA